MVGSRSSQNSYWILISWGVPYLVKPPCDCDRAGIGHHGPGVRGSTVANACSRRSHRFFRVDTWEFPKTGDPDIVRSLSLTLNPKP